MQSILLQFLNSVHPLSPQLKERINSIIQIKQVAKKEFLLSEGQTSNYIYFIEKGFIRSYYIKNGKEITAWFMGDNDLIISVNSFFTRTPSHENVQAIEDSVVHFIHYDELEKIYHDFVEFNIIGRKLTTHYYVLSEERAFNMRWRTAEERYEFLLKKHPEILQKAPINQIATYLGIATETLSRIRRKK
jgi:CRP-like cAMP-binding protein